MTKDELKKQLKFELAMALDGGDGGRMIYRDEKFKCTMTIITPKGGSGHRIFDMDDDKRKFRDVDKFLKALAEKEINR